MHAELFIESFSTKEDKQIKWEAVITLPAA